jgi:hypothetical protein
MEVFQLAAGAEQAWLAGIGQVHLLPGHAKAAVRLGSEESQDFLSDEARREAFKERRAPDQIFLDDPLIALLFGDDLFDWANALAVNVNHVSAEQAFQVNFRFSHQLFTRLSRESF